MALVDLDIGVEEYAIDKVPEGRAALLAELRQQSEQI
jgi:hypothetical protein